MVRWITRLAVLAFLFSFAWVIGSCGARSPKRPSKEDLAILQQAATESLTVVTNPATGRPTFLRGRIPLTALGIPAADTSVANAALGFIRKYARLFGVDSTGQGLDIVASRTDALGVRHAVFQQKIGSVPVYNAVFTVHVDPRQNALVAVASSLVPAIHINTMSPTITQDSARSSARVLIRNGLAGSVRLSAYHRADKGSQARLAWVVEVFGIEVQRDSARHEWDTLPARRDVVIDASKGVPLDIIDRLYSARNREVYNGNNTTTLPGTPARFEGQAASADADVNKGYDFVGSTYDYYQTTHGRDSYDNAGATLKATVHYGTNVENAYWNGTQMLFGDNYAVLDVTAHELTHAVTERTAGLEYKWQSGALNESFSDIFGAMVDRNDWEIGEDLPIGSIRNLANPAANGLPDNVSGWKATCGDNQGVHTNSTIFSKAFVNVANARNKDVAEKIFYRALTEPGMLTPTASMEDARGAAIQSAVDLYGSTSPEATATVNGFNSVGLDGVWQPPTNSCPVFPWPADLSTIALAILALALLGLVRHARAAALKRA